MRSVRGQLVCISRTGPTLTYQYNDSGPGPVEIPTATLYHSPSGSVVADVAPPAEVGPIPSTSSNATRAVTNEPAAQQVFGAGQVSPGGLVLVRKDPLGQRVSPDTSPSTFAVPFFPSTIPPEPRISLSFLGEKLQVQISEAAATVLVMKSCVPEQESTGHKLTLRY